MKDQCCVIVGASHAGTSLAMQLRREGWQGKIKLIGGENELPYHRPPVSKDLLAGKKDIDQIRLRPEKVFQDNEIELLLGRTVTEINTKQELVRVNDEDINFEKLAICTGARPRKLELGGEEDRIFYLRDHNDALRVRARIAANQRVIVIGGGYIGLESAAVLQAQGVDVIVLEREGRILQRVTSESMSKFMSKLHQDQGVSIKTDVQIESITTLGDEQLVHCNGGQTFSANFLIIGVGILPNTEFISDSEIELEAGSIVVDKFGQTSSSNIYAAGDCTIHPSRVYERMLRLESVQNANDQARVVAANICGKETIYDTVPWFWSDQYSIKLQMAGLGQGFDEIVVRGNMNAGLESSFSLFYLREKVLLATDCVSRPKEFMMSKQLIKNRSLLDSSVLSDESVEPLNFLS
jgi:3-phenylpropionate/trans-cinnamate dioxygenase ferredoxin reductase subunit|tara:strand:- start:1572 stop:2798 length:1227 start_codon:yes stop_codon:yes gene_type:complete